MMNINHSMMLNYYGIINLIDTISYRYIFHVVRFSNTYYESSKGVCNKARKIFLNVLKVKIKSFKKQEIYYFNRFKAEVAIYLESFATIDIAGIALLANFERQY